MTMDNRRIPEKITGPNHTAYHEWLLEFLRQHDSKQELRNIAMDLAHHLDAQTILEIYGQEMEADEFI